MTRHALQYGLITVTLAAVFPSAALAEQYDTILVSRATGADGEKGNENSQGGSLSADGRFVAFTSRATNLHPDAVDSFSDVFVRDLQTNETLLVSRASGPDGEKGNAFSSGPSLSADGRYVVFSSVATNLHPDDTDILTDIFLRDRQTNQTLLISRASGPDGVKGNNESFAASMSANGRVVAFESHATNLHPDAADQSAFDVHVFARDLWTNQTVLVSRASGPNGIRGNASAHVGSVSADGRFVTFYSFADNLHPDDPDQLGDVFVRDLQTSQTLLVSRATGVDGEKGNQSSTGGAISASGRFVAFTSAANNLHPDDSDGGSAGRDVFVRDLHTNQTSFVSRASGTDGKGGNNGSFSPSISAEGRFVAFITFATNFDPNDDDTFLDVYVRDLQTHRTSLVSRASGPDGEKGESPSTAASVSADGRFIAFDSLASNLHPDDNDNTWDVFVREVLGPPFLVPVGLEVDLDSLDPEANSVLEPGETAVVAPAWLNVDTAPHSLMGTAVDFIGPQGANYALRLDIADYGVVNANEISTCQDAEACYSVEVGDSPVRPATHWDATLREALSDSDVTTKTWTLHIGASFNDVAQESPFYRPVEMLLHHGITGGCNDTGYCPTAGINRAQMPVFVLRALLGPDYLPPACVTGEELFVDVPAGNAFCRWIEELAHRGVVAGCGGNSYCPTSPVSRAQMAVFLLRTLEGPSYSPPACSGQFADVPCPSAFADWVEELYDRGVTGGCGSEPPRYCPIASVNRQQMAAFVSSTFGLALYGP